MILPAAALTPSGRPSLAVGEVERLLLDKVDLEFEGVGGTEGCQTADRYQGGYAVVTSQRLIWIDVTANPGPGRSCHLPLEAVHSSRRHVAYGLNLMNPKVRLELKVFVDASSRPSNMQASAAFRHLQLRCRGDGPDGLNEHLLAAVAAHKQQLEQRQQQQQRRQQQQQQQQQQQGIPWVSSSSSSRGPGGAPGGPMTAALGAAHQQQQQQTAPLQKQIHAVDAEMLSALIDMGFPRPRVLRALVATSSSDLQAALDWILAASGEPGVDAPWPGPEPSAVSRQELQQLLQLQRTLNQQQPQQQQQAAGLPGWGVGSLGAAGAAGSVVLPPSAAGFTGGGSAGSAAAAGGGGSGSGVIGVAGIMSREAAKASQTSASLAVAFQDLDNLMSMAADMVKLAERFRGVMGPDGSITQLAAPHGFDGDTSAASAGSRSSSSSSVAAAAGGADGELLLDSETQLQLIAMGIASPVTKATAGSRYTQELSRQLADFLAAPLARAGGVMLLPDAYCLFNRARGTELVSPDDLLQACEAFPVLGLPLRLRKFPSGVVVIQGSQFSDAQLCKSIEQLLQAAPVDGSAPYNNPAAGPALGAALSAGAVSAALSLPLTLAKEALLVAEGAGVLCRDDGPEGLRFFANFFKQAQPVAL